MKLGSADFPQRPPSDAFPHQERTASVRPDASCFYHRHKIYAPEKILIFFFWTAPYTKGVYFGETMRNAAPLGSLHLSKDAPPFSVTIGSCNLITLITGYARRQSTFIVDLMPDDLTMIVDLPLP
jgi:hypothetical protein